MKIRLFISILIVMVIAVLGALHTESTVYAVLFGESASPPEASEPVLPINENHAFNNIMQTPMNSLGLPGDIIEFTDDSLDEWNPAVAHCASDQYLVVYEQDSEIYGQRLTSAGELLGEEILITDNIYYASPGSHPDVACDFYRDIFVVTWQYDFGNTGTDYDIHARALYGKRLTNGEEFFDVELKVVQEVGTETNPAIACNSDEHNCLVVYESDGTGSGDIYGQRVIIGSDEISLEGEPFNISDYYKIERNPDLVWGGNDDEYLVVWEFQHENPSLHYRIAHAPVYDLYQSGSQVKGSLQSLLSYEDYDQNQTNPAVAYNCRSREYLIVFQYRQSGSTEIIMGLRITPQRYYLGDVFFMPYSNDTNQLMPAVAYSNGTQNIASGIGADQYQVAYIVTGTDTKLVGQAVTGTFSEDLPPLDGGPVELYQTMSGPNFGINNPDVTGSINNGAYLVVWDKLLGGFAGSNYDIRGRMVSPIFKLTINKSGSGSGLVTSTPTGIDCGGTCIYSYENATTVTLTAAPNAGSTFAGWSDGCSGTSSTCDVIMTEDKVVTATFSTSTMPTTKQYLPLIIH